MNKNSIVKVNNLSMSYERVPVLRNVSFELFEGERLCIVGENGSGKTTLLKGIAGLLPLDGGSIEFGEGITRRTVGYLPQQTAVQRDFPACVHEVVLSGCTGHGHIFGIRCAADREKAAAALKELGISHLQHRPYCDLSGGQQQRVLLARALCATQRLLLLDEPVTGLDPIVSAEMYASITALNKSRDVAVIMVSHDIAGAINSCDRILHIGNGVEFFGGVEDYLSSDLGKRFICGG